MKTINRPRKKAFIGAAISVGTQLIGGIIGGAKKRKAEKAAQLQEQRQALMNNAQQQANILTEQSASNDEAYRDIRNQLMRAGGNKSLPRKGVVPRISEGGTAIPIKQNTFLLKGRKHDTGGIVIGKGKNGVEAESDEVVQITPKQLKVFSAQPILNGNSPAELVQKGAKPEKVFNAQEEFKDRNKLNNDGTKMKDGGEVKKRDLGDSPYDDPKVNISRKRLDLRKGAGKATGLNISPRALKAISNTAKATRVLSPIIEVGQNLFPSKEQEYVEDIRVHSKNPTKGINPKAKLGLSKKPSNLTMANAAPITSGAKVNKLPTTLPKVDTSSSNSGGGFKNFLSSNKGELVSAGIGAAGTIISGLMNKSSINKMTPPPTPQLVAPAKLKTNINVNPQLSDIRETELSMNRNIQGNTASSVASLARQQRVSNASLSQRNKIRGEKENIETQLYNQDAMNRQGVAANNAQMINNRNMMANQLENDKIQANANNRTNIIEGATSGVRDFQHGMDTRRRDNLAFAAELSKNPEQAKYFMTLMNRNKNAYKGLFRLGGNKLLNK